MNGIGYKIKKTILYILLILLSVVCMFPFLLMIVNATRSGSEIMKSFTLIPSVYLKENWATVFKYFNLFLGMWNSLKVAVPSTLLCAYFSAMTAYALAMYKFKGNKVLFMTILIFMMIPGQLGLIGFYNLCTKLHLVNSYIPLIIPAIASPGIATMSIMGFIGGWNAYLLPMIILNKNGKFTLPVMMATLRASTDITANQGAIYLAVAISVIPILLVFAFFSKYIISSISAGAVKE